MFSRKLAAEGHPSHASPAGTTVPPRAKRTGPLSIDEVYYRRIPVNLDLSINVIGQ